MLLLDVGGVLDYLDLTGHARWDPGAGLSTGDLRVGKRQWITSMPP
jgi:hypothetical protein